MGRRNAGQFTKGVSGNPTGKPKTVDARARTDAWMNDLTGAGILGRDKTLGSIGNVSFQPDVVSDIAALGLWRGDAIAARVIESVPNEALRQGWELQIGDDEPPETYKPPVPDPAKSMVAAPGSAPGKPPAFARKDEVDKGAKGLQETISKQLQDLGLLAALKDAMCFQRAYGGGAILIGANDYTTDLREPLDLKRVKSVDWLTSLERRELIPRYFYNDPRAPKFGEPAIYQLVPTITGTPVDAEYHAQYMEVHESRLLIFPGIRVSRYAISQGGQGWGDSILSRVISALRDYQSAHQSGAQLLADFSQAVYTINGLSDLIDQDGPGALMQRLVSVDVMRSTARAILVDANGEKFERQATPMSGFPEMLDRFSTRLAAACDMPLTLLMGQSPGGLNATGESDIRFFYDRVASVQALQVAPAILRMVEICLAAIGEDPDKVNHSVRFKSLWQPSEKESAEAHYTQAQADAVYITNQVVSPEEIALSRFGGDRFSYDTHIDFDARADQEAIVAPAVDADPTPPPPMLPVDESGAVPDDATNSSGAVAPRADV
ncbi:MAG: DUF1073 domain-containing protein [Actinobacteria bacterium]|nr:DUF1073 domain-containing protein [Actinomycetota bacterium]